MKKIIPSWRILLLFIAALLTSCAPGASLRTESAAVSQISGAYRLILYGCNHTKDLETIAILDTEGDRYTIEPYAPDFNYRVKKGVPAKEALEEADKFIDCNPGYKEAQLTRIVDPQGITLGYEVKPLYLAFLYGVPDVLETHYFLKGDKVIVTIRLRPSARETEGGSEEMERDSGDHE